MNLSRCVGSLLDGDVVTVSGISVSSDDDIFCTFDDETVDGVYVGNNMAVCVTPPRKEEAIVPFKIEVRGRNFTGETIYQCSK